MLIIASLSQIFEEGVGKKRGIKPYKKLYSRLNLYIFEKSCSKYSVF